MDNTLESDSLDESNKKLDNPSFIQQRISIYTSNSFDPCNDEDVMRTLRNDLNIHLPQRSSLNDSLAAAANDHEIIQLILKYRILSAK